METDKTFRDLSEPTVSSVMLTRLSGTCAVTIAKVVRLFYTNPCLFDLVFVAKVLKALLLHVACSCGAVAGFGQEFCSVLYLRFLVVSFACISGVLFHLWARFHKGANPNRLPSETFLKLLRIVDNISNTKI